MLWIYQPRRAKASFTNGPDVSFRARWIMSVAGSSSGRETASTIPLVVSRPENHIVGEIPENGLEKHS
jgi:hypothetical protein